MLLLLCAPLPAPAQARDYADQPFSARSPWNRPIPAGARFSGPRSAMTADLLAGPQALIHAGTWSIPVYIARESDPWVVVQDAENHRRFTARIPAAARPDPMGDGHMIVVAPDHRTSLEMYRVRRVGAGLTETIRAFRVDLTGPGFFLHDGRFAGIRAMDASGLGGLLRVWDIRHRRIDHALTFLLRPDRLRHGPVWPSGREDYWGFRDYHGHIPIGTLIAIPPEIDLARLHLSPDGLVLARALQTYGAYCDDSVGTDGMVISAEGAAEGLAGLVAMRADFPRIRRLLRAVTNNGR